MSSDVMMIFLTIYKVDCFAVIFYSIYNCIFVYYLSMSVLASICH